MTDPVPNWIYTPKHLQGLICFLLKHFLLPQPRQNLPQPYLKLFHHHFHLFSEVLWLFYIYPKYQCKLCTFIFLSFSLIISKLIFIVSPGRYFSTSSVHSQALIEFSSAIISLNPRSRTSSASASL